MNAEQTQAQAQALLRACREAGKRAVEDYLKAGNTFAGRIRECIGKPDAQISAWEEGAIARFTIEADAYLKVNGGSVTYKKDERKVVTDGSVGMGRSLKSIQNDVAKLKTIMLAFRIVNARCDDKKGVARGWVEDLGAWRAALMQGSVHTLYATCVNIKALNHHNTINAEEIQRLVQQAALRKARNSENVGANYKAIESKARMLNAAELDKLAALVQKLQAARVARNLAEAKDRKAQAKPERKAEGARRMVAVAALNRKAA